MYNSWHRLVCLFTALIFCCGYTFAQITVRFQLNRQPLTHQSDDVFLAGNFNGWNPSLEACRFSKNADGKLQYEVKLNQPGVIEYKITRGSWTKVECAAGGAPITNRVAKVSSDTTIYISIDGWADDMPGRPPVSTRSKNVFVLDTAFSIPQLKRKRRIWVYLPEDYAFNKKRYPVIYMHDGQNLFDVITSSFGEWGADEAMDTVRKRNQCIIVGIDHGDSKRMNEYNPYDSKFGEGEGDAYVDFLVQTLKPHIDQRFRTRPEVTATSVAGSSMGGLISFYAVMKYPSVFGQAGVFSPAFWTAPDLLKKVEQTASVKSPFYFVCGELEGEQMEKDMEAVYK
ncbi:MAG: alpha/beta hydrolase, partial [Chitinophagaceae bacterium]|nr:alpha/beta hydrolase [Chitinophagaceae bacterium]